MEIIFATGNSGKVEEMQPILEDTEYSLKQQPAEIEEIDALNVEDVARRKAKDAAVAIGEDFVLVEDTGFYVEGLNGFPGAKASFFDYTCGAENLLKLLEEKDNRKAYFKTAVALYHEGEVEVFTGKMTGRVPEEPRGEAVEELPYNSIIAPDHGEGKTLAQNSELKDENFMRVEATEKFIEWLKDNGL